MTKEELIATLADFAKKAYRVDVEVIDANTNIAETFGTASIKQIAMNALIENTFDVEIPVRDFSALATIGELADRIMSDPNFSD